MSRPTRADFPHLAFRRCWQISTEIARKLGQCVELIERLCTLPIEPKVQAELMSVAFARGAQATTAIEGNTLSDEEIQKILEKKPFPKSRQYEVQEVQNALDAMGAIWNRVAREQGSELVTPKLLLDIHRLIGKDLGPIFDAIPGKFRADRRTVGRYLAPDPSLVPDLIRDLCDWLKQEFRYATGEQQLDEAIIEAIVAHVYFEWIHPFGDGNGRTGRMLEFFILARGGLPDIAVHVLANHYNRTRSEYAAHFDNARKKRQLTDFLAYAIQGLLDGLKQTMDRVEFEIHKVVWRSYVYDVFSEYSTWKISIFKRRRRLALAMPIHRPFTPESLLTQNEEVLKAYLGRDARGLKSDLAEIEKLGLAEKVGPNEYQTTASRKLGSHSPRRISRLKNAE